VAAGTVIVILIVGLVVMWRLGVVIQPLAALARQVEALKPAQPNQEVGLDANASAELVVIADAFNDYLRRNQSFVEREHAFIATASHELRTPIAVIAGASELVLEQADMPATARNQVARIHRTARSVEQLISLLLTLAKDPARLADSSDRVALDQLLPGIVDDHRHLTRDKDLTLVLEAMPACGIVAPEAIVQAAIGNLLRNAIENSDRGEIRIRLQADATVVIDDPGHGMSPEEISELYARVARGGRDGGGIGLALISRLCEHLGWRLAFSSVSGRGTRTTLHLGRG
jgi:signal transduction histidine kinase